MRYKFLVWGVILTYIWLFTTAQVRVHINDLASSNIYDVKKNFGATGDGTTDDTAAIQSGMDFCDNGVGILYFPPGTYAISDTLHMNADKLYMEGGGRESVTIKNTDASTNLAMLFISNGDDHFGMSGISWDQNWTNRDEDDSVIGYVISCRGNSSNILIDSCLFKDFTIAFRGIAAGDSVWNVTIQNSIFEAQTRVAENTSNTIVTTNCIKFESVFKRGKVLNNYLTGGFVDFDAPGGTACIVVEGSEIEVSGNSIYDWGHASGRANAGGGIGINVQATGSTVSNNDLSGVQGDCISVRGTNVACVGNSIFNGNDRGIVVEEANRVVVSGNVVDSTGTASYGCFDANNVVFSGNLSKDPGSPSTGTDTNSKWHTHLAFFNGDAADSTYLVTVDDHIAITTNDSTSYLLYMDELGGGDVVDRIFIGQNITFRTVDSTDSLWGGDAWPGGLENGVWFNGHLDDPTVGPDTSDTLRIRVRGLWTTMTTD